MDINLTLLGQMLTFAIFVWFTMKFIWPPVTKALKERQKRIADGLDAAEQGHRDLELAQRKSVEILRDAKAQASHIIEEANKRSGEIVESGKENAREEAQRIVANAHKQIEQDVVKTKSDLQKQLGGLAIQIAEKILQQSIDENKHKSLIEETAKELV
ncbi:MAG: F0F1 ATP synthase subunit B [Gammaproteobacteria bacterium]